MSIRALKKWALLLTFWVALQTRHLHAQTISGNTVDGNFTVTGNSDLQGDTLTFGTRTDNSDPGVLTLYTDGSISSLEFDASRSSNIWKWQQNGSTTLQLQMKLDNNNNLTIYSTGSSPVAEIILSPSTTGTSTFAGSLTVSGMDSQMPNQTLVNGNSVLTERLADSRYVSSSVMTIGSGTLPSWADGGGTAPNLSLDGGTATGPSSFAVGQNSTANGWGSTAMGLSTASGYGSTAMGLSTASGRYSTAMGRTIANGWFSTAMGWFSTASGYGSTAMGYNTTASGWGSTAGGGDSVASSPGSTAMGIRSTASGLYATAMGYASTATGRGSTAMGKSTASGYYATAMGKSTASGYYSVAMGLATTAQAFGSVAIGQANVGGGTSNSWVATDPLFEIGNGTASSYYYYPSTSSAYYLANNGEGPWGYAIPAILSDALVVYKNGNTAVQGTVTAGGTVTAPTFVTTAPAGDIPMYTGN